MHNILKKFQYIIDNYNNNYGDIRLYKTKDNLILELDNGGWSENEEFELIYLNMDKEIRKFIIYDLHPLKILLIDKNWLNIKYNIKISKIFSDQFKKIKKYEYKIKIN